ncbi:snoRNA binding protein [Aureococcus anophagefferens]|nr:snoRNA binding protein [Aureococcus anophagefferens]
MAKKQRRPPARNGGGAGKKAKVGGREALEQEARATFFGGEEDEEISSSDSEAEGERDRGGDGGEEETVEQAHEVQRKTLLRRRQRREALGRQGGVVETLFGHEAPVAALDCAYEEKPLSGGRDRTARCWKIRDESHLVYRSPTAGGLGSSVDACRVLDRDRFLTGGDDGALSLWSARRKKPVVSVKRALAAPLAQALQRAAAAASPRTCPAGSRASRRRATPTSSPRAPATAPCASGPSTRTGEAGPRALAALPQLGFVNGLAAPRDAAFLAAAVAKEPRLGRWEKVAKAKNGVVLYPPQQRRRSGACCMWPA